MPKDGAVDFRGPQVDGKRGDRHIYLNWLAREPDGQLRLFRRAKVMLEGIDPSLVARAESSGTAVRCTVRLTNERGQPTTRPFRAADLDWSSSPHIELGSRRASPGATVAGRLL